MLYGRRCVHVSAATTCQHTPGIRICAYLGTNAGAARESELNPAFPGPAVDGSGVFAPVAEAGVNVGVGAVEGRKTLLPGLKTGADDVKVVGVVVPDSLSMLPDARLG